MQLRNDQEVNWSLRIDVSKSYDLFILKLYLSWNFTSDDFAE
jgi:hypothetical protein